MDLSWQVFGSLIGIISLLDGMILWVVKWLMERHNELLRERFNEQSGKDVNQDEQVQRLDDRQRKLVESMAGEYLRREEAAVRFARLEEKIDTIWVYLLNADRTGS